ncbi:hypothetical protein MTBUT4_30163 [Magnetospirillum sp. UT-4]|nr:hypothetical protein MTBUT4_30163 [Magnetospirillum sp. UT-4]
MKRTVLDFLDEMLEYGTRAVKFT